MIWHSSDIVSVALELNTDTQAGLTEKEANERLSRINKKIKEKEQKYSFLEYFSKEFKTPVYYTLLITAALTLILHLVFGVLSIFEPLILTLLAIIKGIFTSTVDFICDRALKNITLQETSMINCLRDEEIKLINSRNLVPGDVIYLETGNYIPVDARLVSVKNLHCDEYVLSGDSVLVAKDANALHDEIAPLSERSNMIFAGSHVASGSGVAIVTEILDYTEHGKVQKIENDSIKYYLPVEERFTQLVKLINTILMGGLSATFIITLISSLIAKVYPTLSFINSFMNSALLVSALFVSFSPALIKIIIKLSLYFGLNKMKKKGIELYSPQTVSKIAETNLICADKTGTLTQNKMILTRVFNGINEINVATDTVDGDYKMILRVAALCCDGDVKLINGISSHYGDATQTAIIAASMEHLGLGKYDLDNIYPRMASTPFDPKYKLMSTINVIDGKNYIIVRGAVEELIPKCANNCERFSEWEQTMSKDGLRVVGVAIKQVDESVCELSYDFSETDLNFIGLLGLSDMPRVNTRKSVIACQKAGIKVVMFTGDNKSSAFILAQKMKIASNEEQVLEGFEVDNLSDEELLATIRNYSVFSCIDAKQRERIINTYKLLDYKVAVTGDSATNTESLRAADVGYSMGRAGSDSAICESEVVIKDDSFATVVESIKACRGIYNIITKTVKFFFSASLGTALAVILSNIIYGVSVITNCEIVLMWLFGIVLTTFALTAEDFSKRDINTKIDNDFGIFKTKALFDILFNSSIYLLSSLVSYSIALGHQTVSPSSFSFCSMIITIIVTSFVFRRRGGMISFSLSNKMLISSSAIQILLLVILSIAKVGKFNSFSALYWLYIILINIITMLFALGIKLIRKTKQP